ncbi:MAG: hypothetical protein KY467_06155 [Gemmatimonadetes bacterium]|nr:hypothetical protein [Gemmatimonadota bacterium]
MQEIRYNVHDSSFRPRIEHAVAQSRGLSRPLRIEFGTRGGYTRDVWIEIPGDDPRTFRSSWGGAERRFSARLRAAATVLRDRGIRGRFRAAHEDGILRLERMDLRPSGSPPVSP